MDSFPKVNNNSRAKHKLVQGVGLNDAWFHVCPKINGKQMTYPPYRVWKNMLKRCYCAKYQQKKPTYRGCTVCKEWLTFSNFEKWLLTQNWQGSELDKDIILQGNKVYCSEYCRFIPQSLNKLLVAHGAARGFLPLGICFDKRRQKYQARVFIGGKRKHLGDFKTVAEAKAVYDKAKYAEIHRHAMMQSDPLIKAGLLRWVLE